MQNVYTTIQVTKEIIFDEEVKPIIDDPDHQSIPQVEDAYDDKLPNIETLKLFHTNKKETVFSKAVKIFYISLRAFMFPTYCFKLFKFFDLCCNNTFG
jgi:hypothetical protein